MLWVGAIDTLWDKCGHLLSPEREPWVFAACADCGALRQHTFLTGRALLKHALVEQGVLAAKSPLPELIISEHGRPCLPESLGVDFNLSHAYGFMALTLGPGPQGVDLELAWPDLKRPSQSLSERVFSPDELAQWQDLFAPVLAELSALGALPAKGRLPQVELEVLSESARAALNEACRYFKRQWTLREALVKLIGSSIFVLDSMDIDIKAGHCGFKAERIPSSADLTTPDEDALLLAMLAGKSLPQGYLVSVFLPSFLDLHAVPQLKSDYTRSHAALVLSLFCPESCDLLTLQVLGAEGFCTLSVPVEQRLAVR